MPLNSLVAEARKHATIQKQIIYSKPRFIDADELVEEKKQELLRQRNNGDWRECKHLKEANGNYYCNHFISFCAREKCNGRLPDAVEKKR